MTLAALNAYEWGLAGATAVFCGYCWWTSPTYRESRARRRRDRQDLARVRAVRGSSTGKGGSPLLRPLPLRTLGETSRGQAGRRTADSQGAQGPRCLP